MGDESMKEPAAEDRFERVAANYDRWIDWGPRLQKEMPFLLASLPPDLELREGPFSGSVGGILDVGCGTGAHAIALAAAGHRVVGLDQSASMIEQAREAEARARESSGGTRVERPIEWVVGDVSNPNVLPGRWFRGVLALGNVLLAFGEEKAVLDGLESMVRSVAPGGTLLLQYLNGGRIRAGGRLVVKASGGGAADGGAAGGPDGGATPGAARAGAAEQSPEDRTEAGQATEEIWLRHHFEAGGDLYYASYILKREGGKWTADVKSEKLVDLPPERISRLLKPRFDRVEFFDGLSGRPFDPLHSDAVGVRAGGRI